MVKIVTYKNNHQNDIDKMMNEISLEFDKQIFSKSTNKTPTIPNELWVAIKNEKVIGTIGIIRIKNNIAVLKKMKLKKTFRGKEFGISKRLLQTVIKWCENNNISKIYLGTMKQFKAAQMFYMKNGFIRISESELPNDFLNNPLDTVFFELELNKTT